MKAAAADWVHVVKDGACEGRADRVAVVPARVVRVPVVAAKDAVAAARSPGVKVVVRAVAVAAALIPARLSRHDRRLRTNDPP